MWEHLSLKRTIARTIIQMMSVTSVSPLITWRISLTRMIYNITSTRVSRIHGSRIVRMFMYPTIHTPPCTEKPRIIMGFREIMCLKTFIAASVVEDILKNTACIKLLVQEIRSSNSLRE